MEQLDYAPVTPELLDKAKRFVGQWREHQQPYFNSLAGTDAIRHFCNGYGDINPLYRNAQYAKATKYGGIIAPPGYLYSVQWGVTGMGNTPGLTGIYGWYSGGNWEFYRPVYAGDALKTRSRQIDNIVRGKTYTNYTEVVYRNQKGEGVAKEIGCGVSGEGAPPEAGGKFRDVPKADYTKEEMAKIAEAYEKEERRGNNPRYWEDVQVGEKLGPIVKGPISVRDMLGWIMGCGSPLYRAHGFFHDWAKTHGDQLMRIATGWGTTGYVGDSDVPEMVHMLRPAAQQSGVAQVYAYGCQQMTWLFQLFTNWMGDDGWLWKVRGELGVFNQIADTTWLEGRVTKKYRAQDKCCVEIEAWAKNQRGEYSLIPNPAVVILPSKQYGPVVYPEPEIKELKELQEGVRRPIPGWFSPVTG